MIGCFQLSKDMNTKTDVVNMKTDVVNMKTG